MKSKLYLFLALLLSILSISSCNKDLEVNAGWKDITVVYGLLNQNDSVHYVKITKAFLGPGNALQFAKVPDSSNYPDKLEVRMEEYNGSVLVKTYSFDTVTIHDKEPGDSVFYYPDQLMYFTTGMLNENFLYKLLIHNKQTGKDIAAQTLLVHHFSIDKPGPVGMATFDTTKNNEAKWTTGANGKRYQLLIRFHYKEVRVADTSQKTEHTADWVVFADKKSITLDGKEELSAVYPGIGFYQNLGNKLTKVDPDNPEIYRVAGKVEFIFTVAADDLNTYMEVTAPSTSIVQEKPFFTNITNGIGLFSARYDNSKDNPRSQSLSLTSRATLKSSSYTRDLGF